MRRAPLAALVLLAACNQAAPAPTPSGMPGASEAVSPAAIPPTAPQPMVEATATPSAMPTPKPASIAKPAVKPKPEKYMQAVGTEPFWTIDVLPKARLRYSTPDMLHGVIVNAVERHSGTTVRYAARFNGRPFTLELVPVKCSDGMSDTTYPLKATFVHSGRTDHGCARMR